MEPDLTKITEQELDIINRWTTEEQFTFHSMYNTAKFDMSENQRIWFIKKLLIDSTLKQQSICRLAEQNILGETLFI